MAALFASTDNSILITQGSTIGSFCFSEVGFGVGYGYSNIIYSNVQTITEAESALGAFYGITSESSTITEAESALGTFFSVRDESSTISETDVVLRAIFASTNNIVTTNGAAIAGFSFSEVGFADGYSLLVQDNIQAITDAQSALGAFYGITSESSTITEAESAIGLFYGLLADTQTITEDESVSQNFPVSETASTQTITDAQSVLRAVFASLPESITITEAASALGTFFGLLADTQTITEVESALGTFFGLLAESSTITEAQSSTQDFPVSETDSTQTITEAMSVLRAIFADLPESITITEDESALGVFYGLLNELSVITDYQFGRGWIKINDNQNPDWVQIDNSQ